MSTNDDFFEKYQKESIFSRHFVDQMHQEGYWGNLTLYDYVEKNAEQYGERCALKDDKRSLTWSELRDTVNWVAANLQALGIEKGDRIAMQIPNCIEWHISRLGIHRAGAVAVTLMPRFKQREIEHIVKSTRPRLYICPSEFRDYKQISIISKIRQEVGFLDDIISIGSSIPETIPFGGLTKNKTNEVTEQPIHPDHPDELFTTGGTTGLPKIFYCVQNSRLAFGKSIMYRCDLNSYDDILVIAPYPHGNAYPVGFFGWLVTGATSIVTDSSNDPEVHWDRIREHKPDIVSAVPTQLTKMVNTNSNEQSIETVRVVIHSGETIDKKTARELYKMGAITIDSYGAGEAGICAVSSASDKIERRLNTTGRVLPDSEVKIIDEDGNELLPGERGEVIWRTASMNPAYFNKPERTTEAFDIDGCHEGWFHSKDIGTLDEDGYLTVLGRKDDVIIRGGTNIYPASIEDHLSGHKKVAEVAIVGLPDPEYGERACAVIVPSKTKQTPSLEELTSFLDEKGLAKHKWPERIEIANTLPQTPTGKVEREELENQIKHSTKEE